ncbi:RNA polymerase sigma factor [Salinimonas lutimaris]|uniref:RNA polymerase sigma factor n=1 Tax=Salinimonas lutimaris TaxID=914153 RepID=UPI0010C1560D|nr:RNA polymerase sigma factor [Salinimonas lutimaris]
MEIVTSAEDFSSVSQSSDPDHALIQAVKSGDMQAYQTLYELYGKRVYALCYRLTADRALAEDATQEVFIQLWQKLGNFSGQSRFSTWLHSVTANVTLSYIRKQKGWVKRMFNLEDSSVALQAEAQSCSSQIDLDSLICRLPERARVVFVLHAIEGLRHEDIGRMLNIATGSSKAQFHRAKQFLSEWMGDNHG